MSATSLVGAGLRALTMARARHLSNRNFWQRNTAGVQVSQLRTLLRMAGGTVFGKQNGFARLAELPNSEIVDAYRKAVPVADWYAYRTLIARMREEAEPDVLWPGLVRDFAQTSGTTAGDKYIPVSKAMMRSNLRASLDIFANLSRFGISLTRLLGGRILFLGGSTNLATSPKGIQTGDLSGIVTPLIRWPLSEIYLPGPKVALMEHWPSKIEAMAQRCLNEDVRMICGMPSWALVLFERLMQLKREQGGKVETIRDVWPNFSIFVHGGVKFTPFLPRIRQVFSGSSEGADISTRLELYPASEGFVAIQDTQGDPGLRLNADLMNFYEFVPLESINDANPPAFTCEQVEKGQRYVVVMSTCAGLWRYVLGDVVEFDTIPDKLPSAGGGGGDGPSRMRIVGRHRHFINAFGENLIVEHIETAVAAASNATGLVVGEFTAAPVYPGPESRAGLELVVEVSGVTPGPQALERFMNAFDADLKRQNLDYTTKRSDGVGMVAPRVTPVALGTFHRWLESRGKLGGQHKIPRCANGREMVDQLRNFAGVGASERGAQAVGAV